MQQQQIQQISYNVSNENDFPTLTLFLQTFKLSEGRPSLNPVILCNNSWPTREVSGYVQKGWGGRQESKGNHFNLHLRRTSSRRNPLPGILCLGLWDTRYTPCCSLPAVGNKVLWPMKSKLDCFRATPGPVSEELRKGFLLSRRLWKTVTLHTSYPTGRK